MSRRTRTPEAKAAPAAPAQLCHCRLPGGGIHYTILNIAQPHRPAPAGQRLPHTNRTGSMENGSRPRRAGGSVETELVALDVLHHDAGLVLLVGEHRSHMHPAERD